MPFSHHLTVYSAKGISIIIARFAHLIKYIITIFPLFYPPGLSFFRKRGEKGND
ncbi:hypothetical protein HMPREF0262_01897 [Clostridium sp. ATCC 29733]|nr:hypothetical protein HMPREF0262_01897 [Clostridium sp. ATCC 29733]